MEFRLTDLTDQARITQETGSALVQVFEACGGCTAPSAQRMPVRCTSLNAALSSLRSRPEWRPHIGAYQYERLRHKFVALRALVDPCQ